MPKLKNKVLAHVLNQIERDAANLSALEPKLKWKRRVETGTKLFVPQLIELAPKLRQEVELTLNSLNNARATWSKIKAYLRQDRVPKEIEQHIALLDAELRLEARLFTVITGETISNLISDFLCNEFPGLRKNNRSTYPDLYFASFDYSALPRRQSGNAIGPALRKEHPTSVPDGIEIKSQRGKRIRVDCHHDHQGLHLAMTFEQAGEQWHVYDVYLAYLSKADYRRATRNTTATTEKFSFSHSPFISVISGASGEFAVDDAKG